MSQTTGAPRQQRGRLALPPAVTLALWRLRQNWRLLLITGVGMVIAVMLVCMMPLYSQVAMTIGLRNILTASPNNAKLTVLSLADGLSTSIFSQEQQRLTTFMQQHLGTALDSAPPQFTLEFKGDDIVSPDPAQFGNRLMLLGVDTEQAASHATLLRGRWPQAQTDQIELVLTESQASDLQADVGTTLPLNIAYQTDPHADILFAQVPMQVVGIIAPDLNDTFWNGQNFVPYQNDRPPYTLYPALASTTAFLAFLTSLASAHQADAIYLFEEPSLRWDYRLAASHLAIEQLDSLIDTLNGTQIEISEAPTLNVYSSNPQLSGPALSTFNGESILERYRDQTLAARVPLLLLLLQALGLAFFFLSLMGNLVIERQAEAIALLRSRGASRRQIFGTFLTQGLGLGVMACLLGPMLSLLVVAFVGRAFFPPADHATLNSVLDDPLHSLLGVGWYALGAAAGAVLVMLLTMRSATNRDLLHLRRDLSRASRPPLWQRLNLDVVAALIALTSYSLSLYVADAGVLDAKVNQLISEPLALVAPIFLPVACAFLVPRFFPWLLRRAAQATGRRASIARMLALAQMARAPLQAMRMLLLLALALAFVLFTLALGASQTQQAFNGAAHQVGADFSGGLPARSPCLFSEGLPRQFTCHPSLAQQTANYRALPGVTSASLGFTADAQLVSNGATIPLKLQGVDVSTFAQTALWPPQEGASDLKSLLAELGGSSFTLGQPIPAIVDARARDALHLTVGTRFYVSISTGSQGAIAFQAIFIVAAEIEHLPGVNDSLAGGTSDYTPPGGILVSYFALTTIYRGTTGASLPRNAAWLRSSDDPALLGKLRRALSSGPLRLAPLNDRRALIASTQQDPLVLTILGVLDVGAAATLLLALVGSLLASWLSVRKRVLSFVILRAMGTTPRQLASMLLCEQAIIYLSALVLGVLFSLFLIATSVPALVLTSASQQGVALPAGEFYVLQHVLPVQVVLPPVWAFVLLALLVLAGLALWMMVRVASRPALSQALRLSED
jgi:ABC-type antimicrobial peptide transport system permease subunit